MTPKDESYGSMMREIWKRSASQPAGYKPAKMIPTWWDRNGSFIGLILWSIAGLLVSCEVIMIYGNWPR